MTAVENLVQSRIKLRSFIDEVISLVGPNDPKAIASFLRNGNDGTEIQKRMFMSLTGDVWRFEHETRLNLAGFKLFWGFDHEDKLAARIGGDQTENHPEAFLVMTMLLQKHGLLHEDLFYEARMQFAPLSESWFNKHWEKIQPWAWHWVREHPELLPSWIE